MCMLQKMYSLCQGFRGITFQYSTTGLEDDISIVIMFIHIMNRNATFFFSGS